MSASIHTCTPSHPVPDGSVELLGACRSVTGAMTRVELSGKAVLVDCGKPQGSEARGWRLPEAATRGIDAVVLTHGHLDHVAALPEVLERFDGPVYATAATFSVAEHNLLGALGLQGASARDISEFRQRFRAQRQVLGYEQASSVAGAPLRLELHEAGHILGSASVELVSPVARVIVSGDLGRPGSPLLRDYHVGYTTRVGDEPDRPVDLVVLESTYGNRDHSREPGDVLDDLERAISHALRDGGHILIPAFSIGRTQLLLYYLNELVESGRLDDVPVAVDSPLALRITETYSAHRQLFDEEARGRLARGDDPLDFEGLYAVHRAKDSRRLPDLDDPMIVIAGSGMCTGGRIVSHLVELLPRPETCVLFVGYQAPGTPGAAIQRAARRGGSERVDFAGQSVPVRAEVVTLSGLSAHADRGELAHWLHAIPGVQSVALHHGEPRAQQGLAEWVRSGEG